LEVRPHERFALKPELEDVGATVQFHRLSDLTVVRAIDGTRALIADGDVSAVPLDAAAAPYRP